MDTESGFEFKKVAKQVPEGWELRLKVIPGASRSELAGMLGERLKVRVSGIAEKGKANKAVLDLLKKETGVKDIRITAGRTSAEKTVLIRP